LETNNFENGYLKVDLKNSKMVLTVKEKNARWYLKMCIAASQRIFMARDCKEWLCPT